MEIVKRKCKYCGVRQDPRKMIGVVNDKESFYYCMECGEERELLHIKE